MKTHLPIEEQLFYFCTTCSKGFKNEDALRRHVDTGKISCDNYMRETIFAEEIYPHDPEGHAAKAAIMGLPHINTGERRSTGGKEHVRRCTGYLGCTNAGQLHKDKGGKKIPHPQCTFCWLIFPIFKSSVSVQPLVTAHMAICERSHHGIAEPSPPFPKFATADNIGVWVDPKQAHRFVRTSNYPQYAALKNTRRGLR